MSDGPVLLPPTPELEVIEARWRDRWEASGVFRYRDGDGAAVFSVDTPPPFVSASHLHVGHAMSYAQAEFIVRYQRMRGAPIFYPIGFDDNGLPTERFVERKYGINKAVTSRAEFRELCLRETAAAAAVYEDLWRALGLSLDWSLRYSTIDDHCRRTAQLAFVELFRAGRIYRSDDPVLWDPELGTALAQADLEVVERKSWLNDIAFATVDGGDLVISTTRPELLAACVALYCHQDDPRYRHLIGTNAVTPLFGHQVTVRADGDVDAGFGTGLMMVCTFGDAEDVRRWRDDKLPTRVCLDEGGRLTDTAGDYAGMRADAARARIVEDLGKCGALRGRRRIDQRVSVSERSGAPVEFMMRPQWFLRLLDIKDELHARTAELQWHPAWMRPRLDDWISGLRYDWNLSRQRYYGVPFPVWFCVDCAHPQLADPGRLPVDPLEEPAGSLCERCGGALAGDPDVMDTWMTSSLTPQILTNCAGTPDRPHLDSWPMTVRVQAHDIIRTWLFYTLLQSHLHARSLPWENVMISGWGLNEQGKRIAKRDLDAAQTAATSRYEPHAVIARYGADALRHWAARGGLGQDIRYNERDVKAGRKVVIKLWNIARFCQPHLCHGDPSAATTVEDRWLLSRLDATIATATEGFDRYDYTTARQATDNLLWTFADDWVELAKDRIWNPERHPDDAIASAGITMRRTLRQLLGLYAPFLPFVTEELYQHLYAGGEDAESLHTTPWPTTAGGLLEPPEMAAILAILQASRSIRTARRISQSTEIAVVILAVADPKLEEQIRHSHPSVKAAARARDIRFGPAATPTGLPGLSLDLQDG